MKQAREYANRFFPFFSRLNDATRVILVGEQVSGIKHHHGLDRQPVVEPGGRWQPPLYTSLNTEIIKLEQTTHDTASCGYCESCNLLYVAQEPE